MENAIAGTVISLVFLAILAAPIVGGYIGIKHGQRHKLEARKRQMKTAIIRGQLDEQLLGEAVRDLKRDGLL